MAKVIPCATQAMITSLTNPQVKRVKRLHSPKGRQQAQHFVVEGLRLVEEALRAGHLPALMFYTPRLEDSTRGQTLLAVAKGKSVPPALVSEKVMNALATTTTPQSVLAVLPMGAPPWPEQPTLLLILDRLRDPGNLGSALRAAEAAGVDGVFLSPGTVDAFNPKVVRGGMGTHFWLAIRAAPWPEIAQATQGLRVWLAEARGGVPHYSVDWSSPSALIIGAEAEGASTQAQNLTNNRLSIPMPGRAESLNAAVAAGIVLFEAARQRALAQKTLLC